MNEITIRNLTGHSGCELNLMEKDSIFFVRKLSAGSLYNIRLKKQFSKQRLFEKFQKNIKTPKIYNFGYDKERFFFDMEFIHCKTLAEYSHSIMINEISYFIGILFKELYNNYNEPNLNANKIFRTKIKELHSKIKGKDELFSLLNNFDWKYCSKSPCHGDLTLENIMITRDKNIYLIDFLDSFYNSWLIDIAKLLQDLELGWSFRHNPPNASQEVRLLVAKEALLKELKLLPNSKEVIFTIYHILLLNILRIFPYTKDDITIKFLEKSIKRIVHILGEYENEYFNSTLCR